MLPNPAWHFDWLDLFVYISDYNQQDCSVCDCSVCYFSVCDCSIVTTIYVTAVHSTYDCSVQNVNECAQEFSVYAYYVYKISVYFCS